ncbi:ras-associated and pleckstrin homology domains-containing protein 1 isoform X2 [Lucilia sericata]|uniref:ras-associated and pleckstrin homology domains-containing protein 1 isoform X2 n=1 Tax=Lucilia sericata TaxID=13632 RepID=UPI0018A88261|nr:ras-associated and pleckstrin homology domains-containing protein 1 isoform X2 [Lucilia sericata]XP_037814802.1 ras-associated and pleckstrin homology domains-containing protein 1 isoform X2 [Lucilia sericata]XP_037814803.1 ras-associated and pleckstrin homology domains-containing protein 1 isoform X2 [Lucilia sericata]
MDCSLADRRQPNSSSSTTATTTDYTATPATAAINRPQHQYSINQTPSILKYQHQTAVQSLDETIKNLTNLADTCPSIGKIASNVNSATAAASAINNSGGIYTSPSKLSGSSLVSDQQQQQPSPSSSLISSPAYAGVKLRKFSERSLNSTSANEGGGARSHSYRISMANLEETQESELDVILGELSLLEAQISTGDANFLPAAGAPGGMCTPSSTRTHSRTNSTISGATSISGSSDAGSSSTTHSLCSSSGISENGSHSAHTHSLNASLQAHNGLLQGGGGGGGGIGGGSTSLREPRTESPDNDSAFSDTVSLLSSESSASSGMSSALHHKRLMAQQPCLPLTGQTKAAKIQLALHKLETAPIRRLFVKAFTADGASKSLLVDERMTCGHVTRLLADKNHVQMQPNWALVENLGDLQMERLFEDHELLVDNLMTWNSDAGNRVLFQQRSDKISLFIRPELYLPGPQMAPGSQHDEHTRSMLLEEFFETNAEIAVDGPLYMKADSKKGWKRYHFVLRSSGLYYFPKEKTKNARDLACLTLFNGYNVYRGLGWRKKWKAPSDYTFGFKSAVDSSLGKTCRSLKMLCAEDLETMEKWLTAIRVAKYGKQLWDNHKALMDELTGDGLSQSSFAVSMRSESISSISSAVPSQCGSVSSAISSMSTSSSGGRISRASSSSSSGCLSDDNNGFDSEFTTGTIKRKPSMKPNLPLTTMTRQLKEVGEITQADQEDLNNSPEHSGTLTRRHSRRKSQESNGSGTLKRRPPTAGAMIMTGLVKRGSAESMNANNSSGSSNSTPTPTPSICAKPLVGAGVAYDNQLPPPPPQVINAQEVMCSSTLSLDSLPPPPPPAALNEQEHDVYGSQLSLASLPPPPPPEEQNINPTVANNQQQIYASVHKAPPPAVPAKPIKPAVKSAPPYKNPPDYKGSNAHSSPAPPPVQKKVSFADSPVLLRRKMHSPEPAQHQEPFYAPGPLPPPRNDLTRLSNCSSNISSVSQQLDFGSPKRLQESSSNPPRDFLKDLQRVMRKKWQVAQKCKLEPATTPHEVLGFRDFSSEELLAHNLNSNSHYYRDTGNVSNWVQEHYGAGAPPPPMNEYALYENVHNTNASSNSSPSNVNLEPQFPNSTNAAAAAAAALAAAQQRKKRPPPPPPKRSDSTHLTHRV